SGQWVHLKLRVFSVFTVIEDPSAGAIWAQSRTVFERLYKFTQLAVLNIRGRGSVKFQVIHGLDLRLDSGLSQLSSLKALKKLDVRNTIQDVSAADVLWMK
ncbi:hypothetical protein BGZ93_006832, partial [Podila epicladia]